MFATGTQAAGWSLQSSTTAVRAIAAMRLNRGPRIRAYARIHQTVLVVAGLHPAGIDEPRLMALSRELARSKVTVITPEIPELSRFEITPALTDHILQAALWLATSADLAPTGRIGLMGISFSGGLAVVAAGRPALRDRLSYVFALGGHDDLPRVLTYLCTGIEGEAGTVPHVTFRTATASGTTRDGRALPAVPIHFAVRS